MTLTIKRTGADEYGSLHKILICGDSGSGKTRSSSTWPNPLIASINANLMSIADKGIPYVPINSSADLLALKNGLDNPPKVREQLFGVPVDTIIIDCFDHFQQILIMERKRDEKRDTLAAGDWGWLGDEMRSITRSFRNLPLHVVFLAHLKLTEDMESNRVYFRPSFQGSFGDEVAGFVDVALAFKSTSLMQANGDGEPKRVIVRHAQTYQDVSHPWVRDNSGNLPPEFEINFEDDFARLEAAVHGHDLPASSTVGVLSEVNEVNDSKVLEGSTAEIAPSPPVGNVATVVDTEKLIDGGTPAYVPTGPSARIPAPPEPPEPLPVPEPMPTPDPMPIPEPIPVPEPVLAPVSEAEAEAELAAELMGVADTKPPEPPAPGIEEPSLPKCADCSGKIETEDQADLGLLRFRRPLCVSCFRSAKLTKR